MRDGGCGDGCLRGFHMLQDDFGRKLCADTLVARKGDVGDA